MCLIAFSLNEHPDYQLVLAANRDEFYERETDYAHWWEPDHSILAGKDLKAGGTWMGISKSGRFAAITNYRDPQNIRSDVRSRGELAVNYLKGDLDPKTYLEKVDGKNYNGFNLLLIENGQAYHLSNYENRVNEISKGTFGLSNALLDTPWPKLEKLKLLLKEKLDSTVTHDKILKTLEDKTLAEDQLLPETGVPYEWEKALSAICIETENYGTCCSTVITIDKRGQVNFSERSFPVGDRIDKIVNYAFQIS